MALRRQRVPDERVMQIQLPRRQPSCVMRFGSRSERQLTLCALRSGRRPTALQSPMATPLGNRCRIILATALLHDRTRYRRIRPALLAGRSYPKGIHQARIATSARSAHQPPHADSLVLAIHCPLEAHRNRDQLAGLALSSLTRTERGANRRFISCTPNRANRARSACCPQCCGHGRLI